MDRTVFLQMCQKVSVLKNGVCGIKENVPDELKVTVDGFVYYPVSYILSFENGTPTHTAILHDLGTNSVKEANLKEVIKYALWRGYLVN